MVVEKSQSYSVIDYCNTFVSQKIESVHFNHAPSKTLSQIFIIILQADGNYLFIPNSVF